MPRDRNVSVCLSMSLCSPVCLSIHPSVRLSIHPSILLPVCSTPHLSAPKSPGALHCQRIGMCLSAHLYVHPSVSVCPSVCHLSVPPSVSLHTSPKSPWALHCQGLGMCLSVRPSVQEVGESSGLILLPPPAPRFPSLHLRAGAGRGGRQVSDGAGGRGESEGSQPPLQQPPRAFPWLPRRERGGSRSRRLQAKAWTHPTAPVRPLSPPEPASCSEVSPKVGGRDGLGCGGEGWNSTAWRAFWALQEVDSGLILSIPYGPLHHPTPRRDR